MKVFIDIISILSQEMFNQQIIKHSLLYYEMKRQKKTNNIFSQPILPESLFHEEIQKQYKIGGVTIQGTWLKGASPPVYKSGVNSALQMSQLRGQLTQIKRNSQISTADMFRMAELKRKMNNFELSAQSPTKKKQQQNFKIRGDNLILQKISYWGIFQRKCRIEDKQLIVLSEKDKKQVIINLNDYEIQLEQKGKTQSKLSSEFKWPEKHQVNRLFLSGEKMRPYCVYGEQKILLNIVKKIKIKSVQIKQIDFFKALSKQYEQKIYILFGNKLRVYEHLLKQKQKDDLNFAFELLEKSHLLEQIPDQNKIQQKGPVGEDSHSQSSSKFNASNSTNKQSLSRSPIGSPIRMPSNESQIRNQSALKNESQFRIRARRSTINYEDLEDEQQNLQFKVQDFTLEIKQAAYSDDEAENIESNQLNVDQLKSNALDQSKKRNDGKRYEQLIIPEFMHQDSNSQTNSMKAPLKKISINIYDYEDEIFNKFQRKPIEFTHQIYIGYFEDFYAYSSHQLELTFFQKVIPEYQYQNMKIPVCVLQKIILKRKKDNPQIYISDQPIILRVSKFGDKIGILLDNKVNQLKQEFDIDLKKILYAVDQSELVYIKIQQRIHCAGKLKVIISPSKINPTEYQQQSTEQFLENYLLKEQYSEEQKYKFIDYKKRNHEISQKWNQKMMKRIINKKDSQQFFKSVFYGFPQIVVDKLEESLKNQKNKKSEEKVESSISFFSHQSYSMIQNQITRMKVYDLRVFIKMQKLIYLVLQSPKNNYLQKRINDICLYFNLKYGKTFLEKFMVVYVLESLKKIERLLLHLNNAKQIEAFIKEYLDIEYEIDSLMRQISAYFQ